MSDTKDQMVQIVTAYISNNSVSLEDIPKLVAAVREALDPVEKTRPVSPVSIEDSIGEDFIICLEDGKRMKMMKRYLDVNFQMTPEAYREKWGLPDDYPMVCRGYSKERRQIAKGMGLGKT